ncbi:MAG: DUF1292 domain-containing protein [Clostridia bacterium]|nr:DUF1292 domain-containing protein [Clostridia bacterium]
MSETEGEMIFLADEEGEETAFRLLGRLAWKGKTYAFLEDPEDEGSVMVFSVIPTDEGESFEMLEDEQTAEEVFYLFEAEADDYEVGPAE